MPDNRASELADLKQQVEASQREASKLAGRLEQTMAQIETEFGCKSLEEAGKLLVTLTDRASASGIRFDEALAEYKEKYKTILEEDA